MPNGHEQRMGPPHVESILSLHLLLIHYRNKEIGNGRQQSSVKPWWRYTDDGKRMLVHPDSAAHDATVILKMRVPVIVTEHDVRRAVGAVLILGMEETAQVRLNAQHVEIVPGHCIDPGARWIVAAIQSDLIDVKGRQTVEAPVAIAQ